MTEQQERDAFLAWFNAPPLEIDGGLVMLVEGAAWAAWLARSRHPAPERDGLVMVPKEPTPGMLDALRTGSRRDHPSDELCRVRYAALLSAVPSPTSTQEEA